MAFETRYSTAAGLCVLVLFLACGGPAAEPTAETAPGEVDWSEIVPRLQQPEPGVLTGGQLSPEQFEAAAAAGVKTVINLRQPDERGTRGQAELLASLGVQQVAIPMQGAEGLTEENARLLDAALADTARPVIVHCGSGNRVGGLFALRAFHLQGLSAEEALAVGVESGLTRMEPVVREYLEGAAEAAPGQDDS